MTSLTLDRDASLATPRRDTRGARLLAALSESHARAIAALLAIALLAFLPGLFSLHPIDRDEPRYAQASKQMLETGDFIDIRFQDEARHKKPVGIYWMQTASVAAGDALGLAQARTTIGLYRIPSLLGAIAAVLLTYWAALALAERREAFLAGAFLAVSVILMVEARLAKTDAVLLACSVATMGALARVWLTRGAVPATRAAFLAFWLGIGIGVIVKGPMVLLFAGLAAAALSLKLRSVAWLGALRPLPGLVLAGAIALPWFVAIAIESGGAFFAASAGQDMLGKVGTAQMYHWAPPGFYLVAFFVTLAPSALYAAIGAEFAWKNRRADEALFLLAWIVPAWVLLELVPTKLPHYTLPLMPALAIAGALAIGRGFAGPWKFRFRAGGFLLALVPVVIAIGLPIAAWQLGDTLPAVAIVALAGAALIALLAVRLWLQARVVDSALASIAAALVLAAGFFGLAQPALGSLQLSPRLAAAAERALTCEGPQVATLGYREPSLVLLVGTDLVMLDTPESAADFLAQDACRAVFVTERFEVAFGQALADADVRASQEARVSGFNINGGRRVGIGIYTRAP